MKTEIMLSIGVALSVICAWLFGHPSQILITLLILMVIDQISGMLVAMMGKSKKTKNGGLSSYVSWKGISKKVLTLLIVAVSHQIDLLLQINYVMEITTYGLIANEIISILENYSLTGAWIPDILKKMVEVLKERGENHEN